MKVAQSCLTLCDPMDCSLPCSSVHGIFQARVLEWVAISFSIKCSINVSYYSSLVGYSAWGCKESEMTEWLNNLLVFQAGTSIIFLPLWGTMTDRNTLHILQIRIHIQSASVSILLLSSISLHWSLRKAFLSLLAILWNSAFKWVYLSFFSFAVCFSSFLSYL